MNKRSWGEVSPSLQPPRRRRALYDVGGCGGLRYPLCGMLRPATPSCRSVPLASIQGAI